MSSLTSGEQLATVGELELCYETFGDRSDPALVLIMGPGHADDRVARRVLRGAGRARLLRRAVRQPRRRPLDVAEPVPVPSVWQLLRRDKGAASYTLDDMADDVAGLLDHLEIERAHVVGASMGSMIAQTLAVTHPDRVSSLVSIMGNTGARLSGQPTLRASKALLGVPPKDRDGYVEHTGEDVHADRLARLRARRGRPAGARADDVRPRAATRPQGGRQLAAIIASGDRTKRLRAITAPTLVIHGKADKLVRPSGGRATAKAIDGAELPRDPGHGPRPPARRLAADHRRDRRERGSGVA
jgi:pimeloyl-ACP methyl ester carboxylesterase